MAEYRPQVQHVSTPVRSAHPISQAMASAFGMLLGREDLAGGSGTMIYGWPAIGTRNKYGGYAFPPQLFIGWNPRRASAGSIKNPVGRLPDTSAPAGYNVALMNLLATVGKR